MTGQPGEQRPLWIKVVRAAGVGVASLLLVAVILPVGVALAAVLAKETGPTDWAVLGNVGQAYGVLTAVFSAFALAALVITFWMQLKELKTQRGELGQQRAALTQSQAELHRTAESNVRMLHLFLIKMSLDDNVLAAIWPLSYTELSDDRRRQYLYINLVFQHLWLGARITTLTEAEVESHLRHLFKSPLIREYWHTTRLSRTALLASDAAEFQFTQVADKIWQEYGSVLSCSNSGPDKDPPTPGMPEHRRAAPDAKAA